MTSEYHRSFGTPMTRSIEECSELIKALCKVYRFGWIATDITTGLTYDNKKDVLEEAQQVLDTVTELIEYVKTVDPKKEKS